MTLIDTAGLRAAQAGEVLDAIEQQGIKRAKAALAGADVAVVVLDGDSFETGASVDAWRQWIAREAHHALTDDDVNASQRAARRFRERAVVIAVNKCDLLEGHVRATMPKAVALGASEWPVVQASAANAALVKCSQHADGVSTSVE